jgi:organic hydroperoxide reductase OsmC/OhrA
VSCDEGRLQNGGQPLPCSASKEHIMADIIRTANATRSGDLRNGKGTTATAGGGLRDLNYSFHSRFEDGPGTYLEELIAAAHASCYSMAPNLASADLAL